MTLDEIKREREQLEAAIDERQRQIDRARTMAACEPPEERAYIDYTKAQPVTRSAPTQSTSDVSAECRAYIDNAIKGWIENSMAAVSEVLARERNAMRAELDLEMLKLRNEFLVAGREAGPAGRDGTGIAGAEIRDGELTLTLSNGTVLRPGRVGYSRASTSGRDLVHELIELN